MSLAGRLNGRAIDTDRLLDAARVSVGPVVAIARIEPHPAIADVDLQPIAVMFQLMRTAWPGWGLCSDGRAARMDESSRCV
jgi:hypothetical protein